jgi:hypothetical protein
MHQNCFIEPSFVVILLSSMKQNGSFTKEYLFYCYLSFATHIKNKKP